MTGTATSGSDAAESHYEVMTMTSESVLTGLSYHRDTAEYRGYETPSTSMAADDAARNQALRGQHGWYLGTIMYASRDGMDLPAPAQAPQEQIGLGPTVNPMTTPPTPRLKKWRTTAYSHGGAVRMQVRAEDDGSRTWTMTIHEPGDPDGTNGMIRTSWREEPGGTRATEGGGHQNPTRHIRSVRIDPDGTQTPVKVADLESQIAQLRSMQQRRRAAAVRRARTGAPVVQPVQPVPAVQGGDLCVHCPSWSRASGTAWRPRS